MTQRENPASAFIARKLGENVEKTPWRSMSPDQRIYWYGITSDLISSMYDAGFTIPQPEDPVAVWEKLFSEVVLA